MDHSGFSCGTNLLFNSGCMSTSAGDNQGRSKAIPMSYVLLTFQIPYAQHVNFGPAWTPLDMTQISAARIPLVMHLAQAVEDKFWVSYQPSYLSLIIFQFPG